MDEKSPGGPDPWHEAFRVVACGLDDRDARLQGRFEILLVRHRLQRWQDRQVDTEWLVGGVAQTADFPLQLFGVGLGERGQEPQDPGFTYGGDKGRTADMGHAPATQGVSGTEQFGKACLQQWGILHISRYPGSGRVSSNCNWASRA